MNAYRIALILCRAAIIAFWLGAGLSVVSGIIMALATQRGMFGTGLPSGTTSLLMPLGQFVFATIAAILLGVFAPSLCASATGSAMLEGESLSSRRSLEPQEKALAWTGAGFILLFFAIAGGVPLLIVYIYQLFFISAPSKSGFGRDIMMYNLASSFIPSSLRCAIGFVLAFRSDLRRLTKSGENV